MAVQPDGMEHFVEKLTGRAHKRQTLQIFLLPRSFADEHDVGILVAVADYHVGSARMQLAAVTV